jgi:hypothetical protein
MSTTSPGTIVKKAVGWSIGLSVLMIVAGILAIASPLAAGIAVNVLIAWLLVFSGCVHLVFSWYTRTTGGFLWELLVGILYILIRGVSPRASGGGLNVTDDCAGDLCIPGGNFGVCLGVQTPSASGIRLAPIRRGHYSHPRCNDLEDVAVELGMGDRHTGGNGTFLLPRAPRLQHSRRGAMFPAKPLHIQR